MAVEMSLKPSRVRIASIISTGIDAAPVMQRSDDVVVVQVRIVEQALIERWQAGATFSRSMICITPAHAGKGIFVAQTRGT